ncbi:carbohydrate ABC transporter permease [Fundicoccus culcitae]|uniref:Carbohydrate ABC transporter permease n=1 Tax=Fundicoccus culcitae TaxID=2969821 RepID=A0ABY5P9A7_9LACT|nr:carbohydrate ABC transporter permease [Fundicoccus culcitae]UUX35045.1 carbohydrate ABC transporter permease [Fundicoccus culcitae]
MSSIKETKEDKIINFFVHLILFIVLIIIIYPLIYILSASFSDPTMVNSGQMWLFPKGFTLDGYRLILENEAIWRGYANTILYTSLGVLINLVLTIPAAYALSRKRLVGRKFITNMLLVTMFIGGGLIPTYMLVKNLGLLNTIWAMVLPGGASVWNIVLTRTFFQSTIPTELEEAAIIDGATSFQLFTKIVMPLSLPIVAVMALFYGVGHWNEYFSALIYLNNEKMYPLQMVLRQILVVQELSTSTSDPEAVLRQAQMSNYQADMSAILRYSVIIVSTLPMLIVYPFAQKYFVKGVMVGSLKG